MKLSARSRYATRILLALAMGGADSVDSADSSGLADSAAFARTLDSAIPAGSTGAAAGADIGSASDSSFCASVAREDAPDAGGRTCSAARERERMNTNLLSAHTGVSVQFIEQIIRPLKQAGLVVSARGIAGGHTLARSPKTISLADVIRAIEGDTALTRCCDDVVADECPRKAHCPTRPVWQRLSHVLEQEMASISLADLMDNPA